MTSDELTARERRHLAAVLCLIAFFTLVVTLAGCWRDPPPKPVFVPREAPTALQVQQRRVIDAVQLWYPVEIRDVAWQACGTSNSYYLPSIRGVLLCTEMESNPGAGVFFAAHEAGHAVAWQLAGTFDEEAADEIGALALIHLGMNAELLAGAEFFADGGDNRHVLHDNHPSDVFRAWNLACLSEGTFKDGDEFCRGLYAATRTRWDLRLSATQVPGMTVKPEPESPVE